MLFRSRFKLNTIDELPDYDELMAQIAELNGTLGEEDDENYLYRKDEYVEKEGESKPAEEVNAEKQPVVDEDGFELPDFVGDDDDLIKID